jgi:CopG family nickel-responsive transcriptional regulator
VARKTVRFGVSIDSALLSRLDDIVAERGYGSRSQAISEFARRALAKKQWAEGADCAGAVLLIFNPAEKRALLRVEQMLAAAKHLVLSCQLFSLGEAKTLAVVSLKGRAEQMQKLADALRGLKAVRAGSFTVAGPL